MNFTQITTDFARPFAGAEQWNEENDVPLFPLLDQYYRFNWCDIMPFNGSARQWDWTLFDEKVNAAIADGAKFNFCIMQQCSYCSQGGYINGIKCNFPKYVFDGINAEAVKCISNGSSYYQNYNSAFYLAEWKAIHAACYARIVSKGWQKVIGYVDVGGYGNSAEWTSSDPVIGTPNQATSASLKTIIDAVVQGYPTIQAVIMFSAFDGDLQLPNTKIPADVGYYALTTSNLRGKLGWKSLSWGDNSFWNNRWGTQNTTVFSGLNFGNEIRNRYLQAPIVGEVSNFANAANSGPYDDLDREISLAHANSLSNGNTEQNFGNAHGNANLKAAFAKSGAKWTLNSGSIVGNILSLQFANKGLCPVYENFVIKYYLKQAGITKYTIASKDLRLITADFTDTSDLSIAAAGSYDLYISIEDPAGYRKPYPLAITGRNTDGSYLLQSAVVLSGGAPPPPPTPPTSGDTSIFTSQVPVAATDNDGGGINYTTGMKFRSTAAGYIKGVRFYKTAGNSGVHTGLLYSKAGALLASVVFTGETATGWQSAAFSAPVAILANTTYIVALFNNAGNYTEENGYFSGRSVTNGTLTALADGTDGCNGPYNKSVSATATFPEDCYLSANYWVDVIFTANVVVPNVPPVAVIGSPSYDITLQKGVVTLTGQASTDSDGTITAYAWSQISGPNTAVIDSPAAATTQIEGLIPGTYVFQLSVTDDEGATNTATKTVTVHF